jgi:dihydroorotate dehydrogenase (NAD+) catalytic subunit
VSAATAAAIPSDLAAGASSPVDLSVDLGRGLILANPILGASGPFGYGIEFMDGSDAHRLGGICTRSTTLKPRTGNSAPRVTESAGGLLNAVGLHNPGVDAVIERHAPTWVGWRVPVIVNVAGGSIGEFVDVVRRLDGVPGVAGIELNLSCPNAARGGQPFATDAEAAGGLTAAVRRATDLPLIAKLSASVADIRPIARAVGDGGADAVSAINTVSGLAVAPSGDRPLLGNVYGGLSGPAIKPIALRIVYEIAQAVDLPVIGVGGVAGVSDALDFLAVGAVAVQVGTAALADPTLPVRLVDELAEECRRRALSSSRDLVGTALPKRPARTTARLTEYRL